MSAYYLYIKSAHIHLALLSIGLFALRGLFALGGARWPRHALLRWSSYAIDTCLLTSAAMLLAVLKGGAFANGWLLMKLLLILAYITLGVLALRASLPRLQRTLAYVGALACAAQIYAIARSHSPWGWLAG
ncbi:MAG: SirB2 family protein [Pseudomonadota bacterium]|nr:SirB2 family protein [Pseudomonadota bacterium]